MNPNRITQRVNSPARKSRAARFFLRRVRGFATAAILICVRLAIVGGVRRCWMPVPIVTQPLLALGSCDHERDSNGEDENGPDRKQALEFRAGQDEEAEKSQQHRWHGHQASLAHSIALLEKPR